MFEELLLDWLSKPKILKTSSLNIKVCLNKYQEYKHICNNSKTHVKFLKDKKKLDSYSINKIFKYAKKNFKEKLIKINIIIFIQNISNWLKNNCKNI